MGWSYAVLSHRQTDTGDYRASADKPDADFSGVSPTNAVICIKTARLLAGRGVSLSAIRAGRKPGSLVATVKSHCLGIPTLLLQQPD